MSSLTVIIAIIALVILANRRFRKSKQWRATITPLASIIGSGFLVIAPLLYFVLGQWATLGIAILSLLAYLIGAVIRFNITHAEPHFKRNKHGITGRIEIGSQWALGLAYAISVCFYISLFNAFLFNSVGLEDPFSLKVATTILLLLVMFVAWRWDEVGLENVEFGAVTLKLSIIFAVIITITVYDFSTGVEWFGYDAAKDLSNWEISAMLGGMLMVTQGFETPRFMGDNYSAPVRINAIRHSQWIATIIYLVFVAITCPLFVKFPIIVLNETAIIETLGNVLVILPVLILVAATASQLSAALADTIGGGGLLEEAVPLNIPARYYYMVIAAIAIVLNWFANVFEIINYASKSFALYYLLQVLITIILVYRGAKTPYGRIRIAGCSVLAIILLFVITLSIPAPHG